MNRFFVLILFLFTLSGVVLGQVGTGFYKSDIGFRVGAANYLGEIGGKEKTRRDFVWDMKIPQTRTSTSLFGRYKFNDYVAVNMALNYNRIKGDDNLSTNPGRVNRNLRFVNNLFDFTTRSEGYFYKINDVGNRGRYYVSFEAYGHLGVSAFYSNPKGSLDGSNWVPLAPLQTEGVDYKQFGVGIPAGLGFYFTVKRKHRIGWDLTWVTTFTDYLDDISNVYVDPASLGSSAAVELANQTAAVTSDPGIIASYAPPSENNNGKRGDPTHNDSYMYMNLSYSYVLKGRYKGNFSTGKYGSKRRKRKTVRKERVKL
ncbi:MAG: hypothetical protein N4A35_13770 [Flavobacteriales bacterium]|nr:hypothetical protein [Flavobacteriales bacterium]